MDQAVAILILLLIVGVGGVLTFVSAFKVEHPNAVVIERFGQPIRTEQSGLHFRVPLIDKVRLIPGRPWEPDMRHEDVPTRSPVENQPGPMAIAETPFFVEVRKIENEDGTKSLDPKACLQFAYALRTRGDIDKALKALTRGAIETVVPSWTPFELHLPGNREILRQRIETQVDGQIKPWGLDMFNVQVTELTSPTMIKSITDREQARLAQATRLAEAVGFADSYQHVRNTTGSRRAADMYAAGQTLSKARRTEITVVGTDIGSSLAGLLAGAAKEKRRKRRQENDND